MLISVLFSSCNAVRETVILARTRYVVKAMRSERELLLAPKSDNYTITTLIECPPDQDVLYNTRYTIVYKNEKGIFNGEGEKSRRHVTSFRTIQHVKGGASWEYGAEFKKPINNGKFIVKVGDSIVLARTLTGKDVKVDYGFLLP